MSSNKLKAKRPIRRIRLYGVSLAGGLAVLATSCGTADVESALGGAQSNACIFVTAQVQAALEDGLDVVLDGAVAEEPSALANSCVQRFSAGADWVELEMRAGDFDLANDLFPIGEILTDARNTSRGVSENGDVITVVASASDPAGISTWDASIVGVAAFQKQ